MSLNEMIALVVFVVFGVLLFSGLMFRVALHYRDKFKQLAGQIEKLQVKITNFKEEMRAEEIKFSKEIKQTIDECDANIKELNQKIDAYDEAFKWKDEVIDTLTAEIQLRDEKIEKLKDELKQSDEAVKEKSQKNKTKSK
ncbi:hypothetical protein [Bartonella florencae]|uniref:hypothetical protein n=1 Tax=Bartonella florencae TaxID=928210 RepID=UPI000301B380|nr:hypothetical protein [Bartonella florencae]